VLSIGNTGLIKFAPGQLFPGTLTGALATSPLVAGVAGNNLTLQLNIPTLATSLNSYFPQLSVANTFHASQTVQGGLTVTGNITADNIGATANLTAGVVSLASAFNSTSAAAQNETFYWQAVPTGNNTATPSANLQLSFSAGTASPAATGLSIGANGNINFSPSQVFPIKGTGGGTITGITTSSPLTGSGTSGSVALGLNTSALETTLNGVYAQLSGGNTFASYIESNENSGSVPAVSGLGTNGSAGVYGSTDTNFGVYGISTSTGTGVYGTSTGTGFAGYFINNTTAATAVYAENDAAGNPHLPIALKGVVPNAYAAGVLGKALSNNSYGVYAEDIGGQDSYGLYASTTGAGSTAVYGTSTGGADSNNFTGAGVVGKSTSGNGVEGSTQGASTSGAEFAPNGIWGVWGDVGSSGSAALGAGVLGTADELAAGWFANNGQNATIVANNSGPGPAAVFDGNTTYQDYPTLNVTNSSNGGAGEMVNTSNSAVTLYLSNNGTGGVTDFVAKADSLATGALFKTLMASTPTGTCGIGDGDMSCTGPIKSLVSTTSARTIETYAPQSAENWMEDYGTGTMERGVALVKIDLAFAETASQTPDYHVFLTPNADSKGLYVINKTLTSFEVRESGGGTSSLTFDYKIVARRRGYETQRLTDVTERFNQAKAFAGRANKPPVQPALQAPRRTAPSHAPVMPASIKAELESPEHATHPARPEAPKPNQPKATPAPSTHP
jgi:hypothetical protein